MTDVTVLLQVARLGYAFSNDDDGFYWYSKDDRRTGPFKCLDDAAYEALAEAEINEAYKFWKGKDDAKNN